MWRGASILARVDERLARPERPPRLDAPRLDAPRLDAPRLDVPRLDPPLRAVPEIGEQQPRLEIPRTLVVTGHFPPEPGGVQTFTWELVRRLPPECLTVIGPAQPGDAAFDRALGFPVVRRQGYWLTRDLRRLVRESGCTTAWITAAAPFGLTGPLLKRAGVERVVASSHGQELGWLRAWPTRDAFRRMAHSFDILTHLSTFTGQQLAAVLDDPSILRQLAGGVDTQLFSPRAAVPAGGRRALGLSQGPLVVSAARLVHRKGHDQLLEAWPDVLAHVPDARLEIIGVGPMRRRLLQAAEAPELRGTVSLPGFVPTRTLAAHLASANVFVLPCHDDRGGLQAEGLGLSVLEAQACGLPVIVGRSGGSGDALLDGVSGRLVHGDQPAELAEVLVDMLQNPAEARRMGAAGRRWIEERWTWDVPARRLAALLRGEVTGSPC